MAASAATLAPETRGTDPAVRLGFSESDGEHGFIDTIRAAGQRVGAWADWKLSQFQTVPEYVDEEVTAELVDRDESVAHNLIGASFTVGISIIVLLLMIIVAGYFVANAPSAGAFNESRNTVVDVGGTAFILLAVSLLAVPVVAIVGYFYRSGLGGFIGGGGMGR